MAIISLRDREERSHDQPVPAARRLVDRYDWRYAGLSALGGLAGVLVVVLPLAYGPPDALALVRDPLGVAREGDALPTYVGWLSGAGILLWAAAAGVLALAAWVRLRDRRDLALSYAAVGLLTAVLAVDDILLMHDAVLPNLFGIPEAVTQSAEGAAGVLWLVLAWRVLRFDPTLPVLVMALALLGASVLDDVAHVDLGVHEEALKLGGIVLWALWAIGSAHWATSTSRVPVEDSTPAAP